MIKSKIILLAFLVPLAAFTSCLRGVTQEAQPQLKTGVGEVFALADIYSGDSDSTKIVRITSNRSWSAHLNDLDNPIDETDPTQKVSWAHLSEESHPNLSNSTEEYDLVVYFHRNFEKKQLNGVLNIYSDGKLATSVKLTQAPVKYHLKVTQDVTNAAESGQTVKLNVDCNTSWKVRIDPSTTADLAPVTATGFDPTVLGVDVLANEEKTVKKARLIFSAEDCEDVAVEFTQDASTSELDVFNIFAKLIPVGNKTPDQVPILEIDKELMFEKYPNLAESKVKFYCTTSTDPLVEPDVPTNKSSALPEEGWQIRPPKLVEYDYLCVYVLAIAQGYRDCYCKIVVRDWKMGTNYTKTPSNGLEIANTSKLSPSTNYLTCDKDNCFSCKAVEGGFAQIYLKVHNASNDPVCVFGCSDEVVSTFQFDTKYTSTTPTIITSPTFKCELGDDLKFTSTEAKTFLWDFSVVEMKKVKMK